MVVYVDVRWCTVVYRGAVVYGGVRWCGGETASGTVHVQPLPPFVVH